MKLVKDKKI